MRVGGEVPPTSLAFGIRSGGNLGSGGHLFLDVGHQVRRRHHHHGRAPGDDVDGLKQLRQAGVPCETGGVCDGTPLRLGN